MGGREQHFVPQFYLRAFSSDQRRIHLFNFQRQQLIRHTSIKHQCSRRSFYEFAPDLEDALAELECASATVIRYLRQGNVLPPPGSEARLTLLTFVVFQHLRTVSAGKPFDVMGDYYAKMFMADRPELKGIDLDKFTIRQKDAVALPLSEAPNVALMAMDLKMHLFVNETGREFMTSDDPVVLHNQYCEGVDFQGVLGWACRGLQVVMPLSPKHLLLLFDGGVYKVAASHRGSDVSSVTDERDIAQWNALQILNSQNNVYFQGRVAEQASEQQCRRLSPQRPKTRVRIVETEVLQIDEEHGSSLVHHYEPLLPIKLATNDVRIRRDARRIPLAERASLYRNDQRKPLRDITNQVPAGSRSYRVSRTLDR